MAEGQKECLGEVRAAEDTKRTSRRPPRRGLVMTVSGKEPKDEAAGQQYETKVSMPSYSDLTTRHPPSSSFPAFQRRPPERQPREVQGAGLRSHRQELPPANRSAGGKAICGWWCCRRHLATRRPTSSRTRPRRPPRRCPPRHCRSRRSFHHRSSSPRSTLT